MGGNNPALINFQDDIPRDQGQHSAVNGSILKRAIETKLCRLAKDNSLAKKSNHIKDLQNKEFAIWMIISLNFLWLIKVAGFLRHTDTQRCPRSLIRKGNGVSTFMS